MKSHPTNPHLQRVGYMLFVILVIIILSSCQTYTVKCRHIAPGQYHALSEIFDEVQIVHLESLSSPGTYHAQARGRNQGGEWIYLDNNWLRYQGDSEPRAGYKIVGVYNTPKVFTDKIIKVK